ncbi:hypothetical protein GO009_17280 [Muricauda sp. TY007]|uniref:hypothetical protein n=1 Tax=Allomuricauda sp. TY007 TaxID=2683200 RepID=UPI0013BEC9EE|nr:hypothetical protein [Muricauda sp. TY007]NDV17767.1 hypothetical protein [Muricauda sp. TY007]
MRNILLIGLTALTLSCGNTTDKPDYKSTLSKLIEGKKITKVDLPSDYIRDCTGIELTDLGIITIRQTENLERTQFIPYSVIEDIELTRRKDSTEYVLEISVVRYYDRGY